jgi:hypothetical protein
LHVVSGSEQSCAATVQLRSFHLKLLFQALLYAARPAVLQLGALQRELQRELMQPNGLDEAGQDDSIVSSVGTDVAAVQAKLEDIQRLMDAHHEHVRSGGVVQLFGQGI